jgi:hypothetical protein
LIFFLCPLYLFVSLRVSLISLDVLEFLNPS